MKKIYTLLFAVSFALSGKATLHIIQVANFSFSPSNVSAVCGDTIAWQWISGSHTTTSSSVPSCATSWNAPINSSIPGFAIVIPCAGTYQFSCSFHPSMTGTITATCATGIDEQTLNTSLVFPNPFVESVSVTPLNADKIAVYDMIGNVMNEVNLSGRSNVQLDLAHLPEGIYYLIMSKEGRITETRRISKQ